MFEAFGAKQSGGGVSERAATSKQGEVQGLIPVLDEVGFLPPPKTKINTFLNIFNVCYKKWQFLTSRLH